MRQCTRRVSITSIKYQSGIICCVPAKCGRQCEDACARSCLGCSHLHPYLPNLGTVVSSPEVFFLRRCKTRASSCHCPLHATAFLSTLPVLVCEGHCCAERVQAFLKPRLQSSTAG